mmetsp:Transcript_55536/g.130373  ORF Transcript_55536/g.130373 Transcript_55536/m.130373 type:complete len:210 (+) Transcript_55536:1011-1640(+)
MQALVNDDQISEHLDVENMMSLEANLPFAHDVFSKICFSETAMSEMTKDAKSVLNKLPWLSSPLQVFPRKRSDHIGLQMDWNYGHDVDLPGRSRFADCFRSADCIAACSWCFWNSRQLSAGPGSCQFLCMPHTYHLHGNQRPGPPLGWWRARLVEISSNPTPLAILPLIARAQEKLAAFRFAGYASRHTIQLEIEKKLTVAQHRRIQLR